MFPRPGYPPPYHAFGAGSYAGPLGYAAPGPIGYQQGFLPRPFAPPGPPAPRRPPGAAPPKHTTLWVGKIAPTAEPSLIRALLDACGAVREWKPATDAETGNIKGFGFCTFQEPDGVLVALQVLNDLDIDGMKLALKCNSATEEYIKWYKVQKGTAGAVDGQGPVTEGAATALAVAEEAAFGKVSALLSSRTRKTPGFDTAAAADEFLSTLEVPHSADQDKKSSVDSQRKREREHEAEKELEHELQQLRREEQRRRQQEERDYKDALRKWELHEKERQRELERELDREKDLQKERARQLRADNEAPDTDAEEEPWRWRPYSASRRAADRRRRREAEALEEEEGRRREHAEQLAVVRVVAETAQAAAQAHVAVTPGDRVLHAEDTVASPPPSQWEVAPAEVGAGLDAQRWHATQRRSMQKPAFGEEEEEELQPTRKLVVLQYSEAEQQALEEQTAVSSHLPGQPTDAEAMPTPAPDPVALKKQLVASIPKARDAVFAYPIKWAQLERAPQDVKERISGWVGKKIRDLMGEDEPSFCEFIMAQVTLQTRAEDMLEKLRDVLDEDADSFVIKLYQVLIFETEKLCL